MKWAKNNVDLLVR